MGIELETPVVYLITSGQATNQTWAIDCQRILELIDSAISARVSLIQIREKQLPARSLYELTRRAANLTRKSSTKLLVNDRADIALAAGADGVHLTTLSLETKVVRRSFGERFLLGVSTHTMAEARAARDQGADFAVFGPVFDTPSKPTITSKSGVDNLRSVALELSPFLIIALGGINAENASVALGAGAGGVAAIRSLSDPTQLNDTMQAIHQQARML